MFVVVRAAIFFSSRFFVFVENDDELEKNGDGDVGEGVVVVESPGARRRRLKRTSAEIRRDKF